MKDYNLLFTKTKNLTILYVENDPNFQKEAVSFFLLLFKKVITAINAEEALNKYNNYYIKYNKYPDIIISDIEMPGMNGIELIKKVYQRNETQAVIIISNHTKAEYLLELINIGIEKFLTKPLDEEKILKTFNNIINTISNKNIKKGIKELQLKNDYVWNIKNETLYYKNTPVNLAYKELLLLKLLIKNNNKFTTNDEIFYIVNYKSRRKVSHSNIRSTVSRLRKKIPYMEIQNNPKVGYKLLY